VWISSAWTFSLLVEEQIISKISPSLALLQLVEEQIAVDNLSCPDPSPLVEEQIV
jgi:hypothetical protein